MVIKEWLKKKRRFQGYSGWAIVTRTGTYFFSGAPPSNKWALRWVVLKAKLRILAKRFSKV